MEDSNPSIRPSPYGSGQVVTGPAPSFTFPEIIREVKERTASSQLCFKKHRKGWVPTVLSKNLSEFLPSTVMSQLYFYLPSNFRFSLPGKGLRSILLLQYIKSYILRRSTHFWLTLHIAMQFGLYLQSLRSKFPIINFQFSMIRCAKSLASDFAHI